MRRITLILLSIAAMVASATPAVAAVRDVPPLPIYGAFSGAPPDVTAEAWILYDDTFDRVLAEDNADERRAMASTTKIMTALVALDQGNLDDLIQISARAAGIGEAEADLVEGEEWTLRDLLTAMLVRSANDAAVAVAEGVGGSVENFVALMNEKARDMGLENTRFANPHGLDAPGHFTSARDLLTMTRVAMKNPIFATLVRTRTARLPNAPDGTQRIVHNTNQLLGTYPGAIGVKTGYTGNAGYVLVAGAESSGRRLYTVVMGSTDSFGDAKALLDYGATEFGVIEVIMQGATYAQRRSSTELQDMAANSTVKAFGAKEEAVTLRTGFEGAIPVVTATIGDESAGKAALVGADPQSLPTLKDALAWAGRYWSWLWGNG
ncbi:MAG TPA: D-alanyl-D-alanine carboxypeptidase [Actinobacteria bacterium]|nr:D-alanyl-D-alanine carboxypeptidase DacB precursor [bacterium BMS3Bbin01]HDH25944.1 D-alanyl-D-alanine carboxypeptidase [Actinomycetota bacterium]